MTGWTHEGDMAKSVARQLQLEHLAAIEAAGGPFVDEEPVMLASVKSIFDKISFRWRADEASQLDRIRSSVDSMMAHMYSDAKTAIDCFYAELRVPETDPETGMVVRDQQGRTVWRLDERGQPIEKWSQMTGQDIERCLLDLARIKLEVAPRVNELLMEAVFSKHIHDDRYSEAYSELLDETIPGRQAYASRKTRQDKYHAFFCYYLWSSAKVFQAEIDNFSRVLERVRYWRVEEGKSGKTSSFL